MTKKFFGALILAIALLFTLSGFAFAAADLQDLSHMDIETIEMLEANSAILDTAENAESVQEDYYYGKTSLTNESVFPSSEVAEPIMVSVDESETLDAEYHPEESTADFPYSALLIGEELAENIKDMTEEQVLAKFLDNEGGDLFERTLIAEIVCDLEKEWNVGSIHEVLTTRRYFAINRDFWNSIETPSESSQAIAHMVLESANRQEQYLSLYGAYYFNDPIVMDALWENLIGDSEYFATTNYVFVRR